MEPWGTYNFCTRTRKSCTRVSMLPTVVMFDAGRPVGELAGAFSGDKLEAFINDCAAKVRAG